MELEKRNLLQDLAKRFHSYASRIGSKKLTIDTLAFINGFHSYASRIGSKLMLRWNWFKGKGRFPFIRFTNWKQELLRAKKGSRSFRSFHSYASRIGSKPFFQPMSLCHPKVSIHTLHELEARLAPIYIDMLPGSFPFIRFTNWKQERGTDGYPTVGGCSFHSYASRIGSKKSGSDRSRLRLPT